MYVLATTDNPGTLVALSSSEFPPLPAVVIVLAALAICAYITALNFGTETVGVLAIFSAFILLVGALVSFCISIGGYIAERWEVRDTYTAEVTSWLNDVYDVGVSEMDTATLIDGGELAVERNGDALIIELVPAAGDGIAVKVVGGQLLSPVG